ncbi:hypothetical protein SAMN04488008_101365 [Maribacter orientalis]|uniref:Uncharacterized protein n=1 Tax=Maribacter orientalis TaxID=228957 RepID=A0A1H7GHL4_9FLAO|nr:DUF6090 family protein [Maribacter orientalis]SEK37611.1 hypothetical protein SAMN04488008_101365 [Maribacter orientalis]
MIKFFRKIRQNLLSEGKTRKYLKYATGEIVLVVIGILIALQINNWNLNRQNKILETDYLKGININLNDDISELEKLFYKDTIKLNAYTYLIRTFNSEPITSKHQEIITNLYNASGYNWFEGQNVVFENIKSSGNLNLIESDSIKYSIQKYYKFFEEVIKQENLYNSFVEKYTDRNSQYFDVSSFIENKAELQWNGNTGPPDLSIINEPEFQLFKPNLIKNFSLIKDSRTHAHEVRKVLYNKAKNLKNMIEKYLKDKK